MIIFLNLLLILPVNSFINRNYEISSLQNTGIIIENTAFKLRKQLEAFDRHGDRVYLTIHYFSFFFFYIIIYSFSILIQG